jgi:hypothetical protein
VAAELLSAKQLLELVVESGRLGNFLLKTIENFGWLIIGSLALGAGKDALSSPLASSYSNVCYDKETGDVIGERIVIITLEQPYVIYQSIEGEHFSPPDMVVLMKTKSGFSFKIEPPGENSLIFSGKIEHDRILGAFAGGHLDALGNSVQVLPRRDVSDIPGCK